MNSETTSFAVYQILPNGDKQVKYISKDKALFGSPKIHLETNLKLQQTYSAIVDGQTFYLSVYSNDEPAQTISYRFPKMMDKKLKAPCYCILYNADKQKMSMTTHLWKKIIYSNWRPNAETNNNTHKRKKQKKYDDEDEDEEDNDDEDDDDNDEDEDDNDEEDEDDDEDEDEEDEDEDEEDLDDNNEEDEDNDDEEEDEDNEENHDKGPSQKKKKRKMFGSRVLMLEMYLTGLIQKIVNETIDKRRRRKSRRGKLRRYLQENTQTNT